MAEIERVTELMSENAFELGVADKFKDVDAFSVSVPNIFTFFEGASCVLIVLRYFSIQRGDARVVARNFCIGRIGGIIQRFPLRSQFGLPESDVISEFGICLARIIY